MRVREIFNSIYTFNWGMICVILATIWIWYAIFTIGFFPTLAWILIGACMGGVYYKFTSR